MFQGISVDDGIPTDTLVGSPCLVEPQPAVVTHTGVEGVNNCKISEHIACAATHVEPMDVDPSQGQLKFPASSMPANCSPQAPADNQDRKITDAEFQSIQQLTAKFDIDACCDDKGINALVPYQYCSPNNSFLQHDCSSQHVWINAPFDSAQDFIKHYLDCKASSPHNTSACILVPDWRRAPWQPLLKGMQVIKQYSRGTRLFEAPSPTPSGPKVLLPGIRWNVTVYYDPPKPRFTPRLNNVEANDHLLMTFDARLAGVNASVTASHADHPAQAVSDSAASHCFLSRAWVQRARAHVKPLAADDSAAMADGSAMKIFGTCTVKLTLGPFSGRVKAFVTDLASHHDLILGEDWLKQHAATICYHKNALMLRQGARTFTVPAKRWLSELRPPVSPYLSAIQAKRAIRKQGNKCFLVLVREGDTEAAGGTSSAAHPGGEATRSSEGENPELVPDAKLQSLLDKYKHRFSMELPQLPSFRGPIHHTIPLVPGAKIPPKRTYRMSPKEKAELHKFVKDLLDKGLIEPSASPFGAPVLFVPKPDGSYRMCIDYRALNAITVKDRYPLPRIDDLLDQLQGTTCYSSMDLLSGYYQARILDEDVPKTSFTTDKGHYQWRVLPMGLSNAPSTFQRLMNWVFQPYIGKFVFVYLDDILVASRNPEEHLHHLELVLQKLAEHDLFVKPTKCKSTSQS